MTLQNPDDERARRLQLGAPFPGCVLLARKVKLGDFDAIQVYRYHRGELRQHKVASWPTGRLDAAHIEAIEAVVLDQLQKALVQNFGASDEVTEAAGPL